MPVISTKAEGRVEKPGREWTLRQIRGQMSRLRYAPLDMTDSIGLPPNQGETTTEPHVSTSTFVIYPCAAKLREEVDRGGAGR